MAHAAAGGGASAHSTRRGGILAAQRQYAAGAQAVEQRTPLEQHAEAGEEGVAIQPRDIFTRKGDAAGIGADTESRDPATHIRNERHLIDVFRLVDRSDPVMEPFFRFLLARLDNTHSRAGGGS